MGYTTEQIAETLKTAREMKGLSQRALSKLAGMPQSHISKIENGAVDLRLSSLVEFARALDLEVTLVPRKNVPAVQSIVRSSQPGGAVSPATSAAKELKRLQQNLGLIADRHPAVKEVAQLQRRARELQHFQLTARKHIETIREANEVVQAYQDNAKWLHAIRKTVSELQSLRDSLVHALPVMEYVKPVYGLGEDDHG